MYGIPLKVKRENCVSFFNYSNLINFVIMYAGPKYSDSSRSRATYPIFS